MENRFMNELADTANTLIAMLCDCEFEVVEFVLDCINNNGYVFIEDLQKLDRKE